MILHCGGTTVLLGIALATATVLLAQGSGNRSLVVVAQLGDAIHPISAEYIVDAIDVASRQRADLFVLQIDTPGGLDQAMRDIVQAFLAAPVPVCLFVGPAGARAASAGFFMAMAADIVVMAPGTNMGAASPVAIGGSPDETMQRKLMQDAEAYIRSVALEKSRPPELAAAAVIEGRSFSAAEAIATGLADFEAEDLEGLLDGLAGRVVEKGGREFVLDLTDRELVSVELTLRQRILSSLANPTVAYLLMLIGVAGLYFELSTPGAVLPGVVGGLSLILAMLAFQILPISFAGLALIALGVVFLILEIKVTSYGLLSVAGLVAFVLGSLMLIPGPIPEMRVHPMLVFPAALAMGGIVAFLVRLVIKTHRGRVRTGRAGLVGEIGKATNDFGPDTADGAVFVHGENWKARSAMRVRRDDPVEVVGVGQGLVIRVRPHLEQKGS